MGEPITITIDGTPCRGEKGMTILEVAKANEVDIPTLCHHPWLTNHGACRMCVVEVEGQRKLVTACAAPATDGMVVTAHNDRLHMLRQMTLELLFAERNHICPYCPMTGVCELQNRAYQHGITHTRYDYIFPVLNPDTTNPHFVQDHNRCILCGRCVRACYELVGVGTLAFGHRGSREVIVADLGVPLGESTCISCGTCVDVCPTGALFDKRAPYFAKGEGLDRRRSICPDDDLGCVMNVVLRSGMVARNEGCEDAPVNGPLLSHKSRYELLHEPHPRVLRPMMRDDSGRVTECDWETALNAAAAALAPPAQANFDTSGRVGLASERLPLETLEAFFKFMTEASGSGNVDTLRGEQRQTIRAAHDIYGTHEECSLEAVHEADMVLLVGLDPPSTHPVLGAWLSRKVHHEQCPVVCISPRSTKIAELATVNLKPRRGGEQAVLYGLLGLLLDLKGLDRRVDRETAEKWRAHPPSRAVFEAGVDADDLVRIAHLYAKAQRPVILYGPDVTGGGNPTLIGRLWEMAKLCDHHEASGAIRVRGLTTGANSAAAEAVGYRGADLREAEAIVILQGDDPVDLMPQLRQDLRDARTVILMASHQGPLTEFADIILPSLKWSERGGTWLNVTGLRQEFAACAEPPKGIRSDEWVLNALAERMSVTAEEATHE